MIVARMGFCDDVHRNPYLDCKPLKYRRKRDSNTDSVKEKFRLALGYIAPIFTALRAERGGIVPT